MNFDYTHPNYLQARQEAFKRSNGWCQFCGRRKAEEAHHWRGYESGYYPSAEKTVGNDLTALCKTCHDLATDVRQVRKVGHYFPSR